MPAEPRATPIPTEDLAAPARRVLDRAGYTTLEQLADVSEVEVVDLHGVGPSVPDIRREALGAHGLSFSEVK